MQTLSDYQKTCSDKVVAGVFDWLFEEDSGLMAALPVRDDVGINGEKYNVEIVYPTASWLAINDVIPEDTGSYVQRNAALYQLLGDADVSKFAIQTNTTQNQEALEITRKLRGFKSSWYDGMIYGQTTTSSGSKQPKGLLTLIAELESATTTDLDGAANQNSQVIANHATSGDLTLANLETAMDRVRLGCNALVMSRASRRKINALARAAGTPIGQDKDAFNHWIEVYNKAKIYIVDNVDNNIPDGAASILSIAAHNRSTTWASGYDNTVIFCLAMKDGGFSVIQNGGLTREPRFTAPNKDAWRYRFKWYCGFALFNKFAASVLINVVTAESS